MSFCYVYFRTKSKTNTLYFHKSPCVWNQFPVISHKAVVLRRLLLHGFPSSQSFARPSSDLEPPNEWQSKIKFQAPKCEIMFQCFSMLPPSSSAKTWSFDFNATECNSYERIRTDKDFSALQVVKWRKMHLLNITINNSYDNDHHVCALNICIETRSIFTVVIISNQNLSSKRMLMPSSPKWTRLFLWTLEWWNPTWPRRARVLRWHVRCWQSQRDNYFRHAKWKPESAWRNDGSNCPASLVFLFVDCSLTLSVFVLLGT